MQKSKKKNKINVVFNYSGIELSEGAQKVLNRGLNFSLTPEKLNITQLLADISRFERLLEWKEYWYGKESDSDPGPKLFKQHKTNRPKDPVPKGITTFINSMRSELMDMGEYFGKYW